MHVSTITRGRRIPALLAITLIAILLLSTVLTLASPAAAQTGGSGGCAADTYTKAVPGSPTPSGAISSFRAGTSVARSAGRLERLGDGVCREDDRWRADLTPKF